MDNLKKIKERLQSIEDYKKVAQDLPGFLKKVDSIRGREVLKFKK